MAAAPPDGSAPANALVATWCPSDASGSNRHRKRNACSGSRQHEPASLLISHGSVITPMFGTVSHSPDLPAIKQSVFGYLDTSRPASSISCTISSGWVATEAWLVGKVVVFLGFIRSAIHFSVSGRIRRSLAEIWYQLGFTFHAGDPSLSSKQRGDVGFCVRAQTNDSDSSSRS